MTHSRQVEARAHSGSGWGASGRGQQCRVGVGIGVKDRVKDRIRDTVGVGLALFDIWFGGQSHSAHLATPTTYCEHCEHCAFSSLALMQSIRTQRGLARLVDRGLMTEREYFVMTSSGVSPSARHNVVIGWIMARTVDGRARDTLEFGAGTESVFVNNILELRAKCNSIPDETVARMPLAYVHLVHLLTDSLLIVAPVALYSQVGVLSVPLSGLLTIFFRGLLELSKTFLDPFGNAESYDEIDDQNGSGQPRQAIRTDALICEVNSASTRWWRGAERLPFDTIYTRPERMRYLHQPSFSDDPAPAVPG